MTRSSAPPIDVLIAGPRPLHLDGIAALLVRRSGIRASTAVDLERVAHSEIAADVVVVDTPGRQSLGSLRRITRGGTPVVVLGVPESEQDVIAFAESGVLGFVERDASLDELVECVSAAAQRQARLPPRVATALVRHLAAMAERPSLDARSGLTRREREIVELIELGLSNREIAARLSIEVATVKNHVHNILDKLDVRRRDEAAARLRVVETPSREAAVPLRGSRAG